MTDNLIGKDTNFDTSHTKVSYQIPFNEKVHFKIEKVILVLGVHGKSRLSILVVTFCFCGQFAKKVFRMSEETTHLHLR